MAALIGGLIGGVDAVANGGNFFSGFFVGAVGGAIGFGYGQMFGTSLMGSALTGAFTSGTMSELMGGNFGDGFRTGFISGGVASWLGNKIPEVNIQKPEYQFLAPIRNWFINALSAVASNQKISGSQFIGATISSIFDSTFVFTSEDADYVKELKALGIEIKGDFVRVEKTQTMEDGVVTTKFKIYVKKELGSLSIEPDAKNIYETQASYETNSSIIMMDVSVTSTGALTVDAYLGFENKYLTRPYVKVNGDFGGSCSRDTTPGIESIPRMWRRYQWDTTITNGHANLDAGIIYRPISEPLGNWAGSDQIYVKMNLSQYLK